jgi:hypothetical protein
VAGGWRKLFDEELHDKCFSPNIIDHIICQMREDEMGGECCTNGEMRNYSKF